MRHDPSTHRLPLTMPNMHCLCVACSEAACASPSLAGGRDPSDSNPGSSASPSPPGSPSHLPSPLLPVPSAISPADLPASRCILPPPSSFSSPCAAATVAAPVAPVASSGTTCLTGASIACGLAVPRQRWLAATLGAVLLGGAVLMFGWPHNVAAIWRPLLSIAGAGIWALAREADASAGVPVAKATPKATRRARLLLLKWSDSGAAKGRWANTSAGWRGVVAACFAELVAHPHIFLRAGSFPSLSTLLSQ